MKWWDGSMWSVQTNVPTLVGEPLSRRLRGADAVVHEAHVHRLSVCNGHFSSSNIFYLPDDTLITCMWCAAGVEGHLQWFEWGV